MDSDHSLAIEQASALKQERAGHLQLNNLPVWKHAEEKYVSLDLSVTPFY